MLPGDTALGSGSVSPTKFTVGIKQKYKSDPRSALSGNLIYSAKLT